MTKRVCLIWALLALPACLRPSEASGAQPPDPALRRWSDESAADYDNYDARQYPARSPMRPDPRYARVRPGAGRRGVNYDPNYNRANYNQPVTEEVNRPPAASYQNPPAYQGPAYQGSPYQGPADGPLGDPAVDGGGFYDDGYYDDGSCEGCWDGCSNNCWTSGPIYVRGEYLLWWLKGDGVPALVTTSPQGTPRAQAGVLGQTGTSVLFGDSQLNSTSRSGGRVVLGWWADPTMRIEAEFFGLGSASANFNQTSTGDPILARPFFNLGTGAADSNVIAYPSQLQGTINVSETSQFFGAGIHATQNLVCADFCNDRHYRIDFLYGYRYLRLRENLSIDGTTTTTGGTVVPIGTSFASNDSFTTTNNFNGLDLGMTVESRWARWCLTTIGRLGIGGNRETVAIAGSSTATVSGTATTSSGGLLAMPSNIGTQGNTAFALVPQLELKLGYDLSPNWRFTIGYDVIYWSRVVRPGGQVDTNVNTSQASGGTLVGVPGPLTQFRETDLWVQGLSVGGEFRY